MVFRTKTLFLIFVFAESLLHFGCGYPQQSRFQMSFLPPAPHSAGETPVIIEAPPEVQPNLYLKDVPPLVLAAPPLGERRSRAEALVQRADQQFQRGKRLYQVQDIPNARREFDSAIDLMLDASDQNPADRTEYDHRLDEMVDAIHQMDLAGMGAAAGIEEGRFEKAPLEDILQMTFPVDPRLKDRVRDQVAATVSQLPLSVNDTVLGYIHYFSTRGHKTLISAYQRSGRYRPMIQRILDEEGLPQELIHLAQAESGFIPRAMSRMAAGGMWQFLAWRGQEYGLNRTPYTDDRMDPEKATRAAARHLHDLYTEFGDWYLAIAAYNCGPGAVEKAVERTGYADFWELRARGVLPAETTNYVPIILAMTIMEKNAAEYGFDGVELDPPLEYDTFQVTAPTSMALISDITDTSLPQLAAMNPGVLKSIAPANYALHVPKGAGNRTVTALELVPAEHRDAWRMHRVGPGETLSAIAQRYRTSASNIVAANNLRSSEAVEGDSLVVPAVLQSPVAERRVASRTSTRHTSTRRASAARRAGRTAVSSAKAASKSGGSRSAATRRASRKPSVIVADAGGR
jgi:membrane-bound lytic murein transglycosylase D